VAAVAALGIFSGPAAADPTGVTGATAASASAVAAAADQLPVVSLRAEGAYRYHGRGYVLPRTKLVIRGSVRADLGDGPVEVEILRHGRLIRRESVDTEHKGGSSSFHMRWRAGNKSRYTIRVKLTGEQSKVAGEGHGTKLSVVRTNIHYGSHGVSVRLFQHELRQLAYVAPLNGRFDAATGRALIAYRKVTGMSRRPSAGYGVARKLAAGKGRFHLRYPNAGRHVEVSIRKQVMAFASNGKVVRIYHVSTGKPSTPTVRGTYRVYSKDPGTNAKGMVMSSYFTGGYAIHGYAEVPVYAASHGCVRVPVPNASSIYNWVHMGTRVDTYY
jgi:hypothetical protein